VNRVIQHIFGITAKQKLTEIRFLKIQEELQANPQNKCFVIALNNEKELYKFLSRNFSTTISALRINNMGSEINK